MRQMRGTGTLRSSDVEDCEWKTMKNEIQDHAQEENVMQALVKDSVGTGRKEEKLRCRISGIS